MEGGVNVGKDGGQRQRHKRAYIGLRDSAQWEAYGLGPWKSLSFSPNLVPDWLCMLGQISSVF